MTTMNTNICKDIFIEKINDGLPKEYVNIIQALENIYSANCQNAAVAEESAELKIIVDRVGEFAERHQYYKLYNAVLDAFDKIKSFQQVRQDSGYYLPDEIIKRLKKYISVHESSVETIESSCKSLLDIESYNENSKTRDLKRWAESLEKLGDAFEDNIEFFSLDCLDKIQPIFWNIIEKSQKKSFDLQTRRNTKESYRVRIRNAAAFMSNLIDYVIEESNLEEQEILAAIEESSQLVFCER